MARTVNIGAQDFGEMIENNDFYIDKTDFIKEWWENRDAVTLIARPRRFGKTLTMSMTEYFFSLKYAQRSDLFEGLNIWREDKYRKLQGTFPVIFLSFASVKADNYEQAYQEISELIAREYRRNAFLLKSDYFLPSDEEKINRILSSRGSVSDICSSINLLSEYLYEYYGKKVIILLDEYDTPMQEAYVNGYWEKIVEFMRSFFNSTFKTNRCIERGLMTGITRVGKKFIFSDLNNPEIVTAASNKYQTAFGFTEEEVFRALDEFGLSEEKRCVREWYDGFKFGECGKIYNPWSITQFLDKKKYAPYWANTSSNALVGKLIRKSDVDIKLTMEDLLHGKSIRTHLDEEIVFKDLQIKKSALWSLLLASGYLKLIRTEQNRLGDTEYVLALTNKEVFLVFKSLFAGWFSNDAFEYNEFSNALLLGDKNLMNEFMNDIVPKTMSFYDTGVKSSRYRPQENFYHGFVLGLITSLKEIYDITSNRESGQGRYDVLMEPYDPKQDDGMILEFKVFDSQKEKSLKDTVQTAILQIIDKNYAAVLESKCGRNRIRIYGFAFHGKEVLIDGGYLCEYESPNSDFPERVSNIIPSI